MRHYPAYKTQSKAVLFGVFLVLSLFSSALISYAQTANEIRDKIEQKNADIARLEQEIRAYQAELNELGKQKDSLSVSIKELDINRKKLTANIAVMQDKIDRTNLKIQTLGTDIGNKENEISTDLQAISLGFRKIDELEQGSLVEAILAKDDFSTIWNDIDSAITIRDSLRENIIELGKVKTDLQNVKDETTVARNELVKLRSDLADQKKIVDQNTAEKNKLLSQTKNSESAYQQLLASQLAQKQALEKDLRDYESQLKFILDPSKLPSGGVLAWPLDNNFVTQLFGKTADSGRLYASGSHSGVDFRASVGTPVKAMSEGIVVGAGNTDTTCNKASFGQWILIKYNNGLASTYGHLSLIKVSVGQKVSRGEVVGYSGASGHVTGPHLHVSLYAGDAVSVATIPSKSCTGKFLTQPTAATNGYLDPMFYLPPYSI